MCARSPTKSHVHDEDTAEGEMAMTAEDEVYEAGDDGDEDGYDDVAAAGGGGGAQYGGDDDGDDDDDNVEDVNT